MLFISRCTAFSYLEGDPELAFFAVYDGHGGTGMKILKTEVNNILNELKNNPILGVANYLKDHLHEFILDQREYQEGNIEEAIVKAFLQVILNEVSNKMSSWSLTMKGTLIVFVSESHYFMIFYDQQND